MVERLFPAKALPLRPEVHLLSLGSNDIGNNFAASENEANYDSIRTIAMRAGVRDDGVHTNNRGHLLLFERVVAADLVTIPTALAAAYGARTGLPGSPQAPRFRGEAMGTLTVGRFGTSIRLDLQGRRRPGPRAPAMP